jgi:hypothetical protein
VACLSGSLGEKEDGADVTRSDLLQFLVTGLQERGKGCNLVINYAGKNRYKHYQENI